MLFCLDILDEMVSFAPKSIEFSVNTHIKVVELWKNLQVKKRK